MMENKRPAGVIVFGILIILGALFQMVCAIDFSKYKFMLQPLADKIITVHYYITIVLLTMSLVAGIGIFFLKNVFRKIILITAIYTIYSYMVEMPLIGFKNAARLIEQTVIELSSKTPNTPAAINSSILWITTALFWAVDLVFAICLLIYFTRPKVKAQFK